MWNCNQNEYKLSVDDIRYVSVNANEILFFLKLHYRLKSKGLGTDKDDLEKEKNSVATSQ